MFMRASLYLIGISGAGVIACAVPAPEPTEATSSAATAIIVVERTAGPGEAVRGDAVIARFVRVKHGTVDDPALRIAGVAEDVPPAGSCVSPADNALMIQGRAVELLDVGQVTLSSQPTEGALKSTVLLPRSMPDPAGVVSGVFYSSRSADVFAPSSRVSLRSGGGPDLLESFNVTVTAPRDLTDVRVATVPAGLDVTWDASEGVDAHDVVYVDVLSPAPRVVVRCAGADSGHLLVPSQDLRGSADDRQVVVHRLHKEAFKAKGIDPGEVRFDVAKIASFRR